MITREDIENVMNAVVINDITLTMDERNELRRQAVVEFLEGKPNSMGLQGDEHSMILSDLKSYPAWEEEHGRSDRRGETPASSGRLYPRTPGV